MLGGVDGEILRSPIPTFGVTDDVLAVDITVQGENGLITHPEVGQPVWVAVILLQHVPRHGHPLDLVSRVEDMPTLQLVGVEVEELHGPVEGGVRHLGMWRLCPLEVRLSC